VQVAVSPPLCRYLVHVGVFSVEVESSFDPQVLAQLLRVVAAC
jgi:hypothetical protein